MERYVEWKPFYSVGEDSLDREHQRIIGLVDDLYMAIEAGEEQFRVRDILDRLAYHAVTHFTHEERVMRQCRFPEPQYTAHKAMHDEMQRRVCELCAKPEGVAGHELLHFLRDWWVEHIQSRDKEYSAYINAGACETVKTQ
jgi:hemerythrin